MLYLFYGGKHLKYDLRIAKVWTNNSDEVRSTVSAWLHRMSRVIRKHADRFRDYQDKLLKENKEGNITLDIKVAI